ncbi:hypothetical protein C2G38_2071320 [Gigaspora rosea]|uniref:Uncharacterized protein n=1 Tax=Gigaspora rosea TaxID=44941 RepID=A0A397VSC8_9GLOM|nr:hypothetical protein C2G38_2071320 [Gigaspora rosea]
MTTIIACILTWIRITTYISRSQLFLTIFISFSILCNITTTGITFQCKNIMHKKDKK